MSNVLRHISETPASRVCRKCRLTIEHIGGAWVVMWTGTTADGLSYCPPNPDARKVGEHKPYLRGNAS